MKTEPRMTKRVPVETENLAQGVVVGGLSRYAAASAAAAAAAAILYR